VTGMPLAVEDLMPLKTNDGVKVRDNKTASLPGLFAAFQDECGSTGNFIQYSFDYNTCCLLLMMALA